MSEQQPQDFNLAQELRDLGEQLTKLLRVARDHPQTKEFERQVSQAVKDLGEHIDRAMKTAKEDEHVKNVETQVRQFAQSVKDGGAKDDIERGLAKGVRALNEQIRRTIEDAEQTSKK